MFDLSCVIESEEKQLRAFGARLKEVRAQLYVTQDKLAELSGLDLSHIARMETAKRNPKLTTLITLSIALKVSLSELLDFPFPLEGKEKP